MTILVLYSYYVRELLVSLSPSSAGFFSMGLLVLSVFLGWSASELVALSSSPAAWSATGMDLAVGTASLAIESTLIHSPLYDH